MKIYNLIIALLSVILIYCAGTLSSCKPPDAPKAVVTVTDTGKYVISGAKVRVFLPKSPPMYLDPNQDPPVSEDIQYTDAQGQVSYEFPRENIFNVEVTFGPDTARNFHKEMKGEGVLILKYDETYEETIILR